MHRLAKNSYIQTFKHSYIQTFKHSILQIFSKSLSKILKNNNIKRNDYNIKYKNIVYF